MTAWAIWFVAAGVLIVAELFTGTFYLLMIALGVAAGGIAALAGTLAEWQLLAAALIGIGAVLLLRRSRFGRVRVARAGDGQGNSDPNILLDIGQTVEVPVWQMQGQAAVARVPYRGALWDVELAPGHAALPGPHVIREVRGSRLLVAPR